MSSDDDAGEPMTILDSYGGYGGGYGSTSSIDSRYNNDGTIAGTGFKYSVEDFSIISPSTADSKLLRTKFGGLQSIAKGLHTDLKKGICHEPSLAPRLHAFGENRLPEPPMESWLRRFLDALQDVALMILMVAAVVALVGGLLEQFLLHKHEQGWIEGVSILVTVFLVAGVTATNDYQKEKQFRALKKQSSDRKVRVIRDGQEKAISLFDIVVGDVVKVVRGDMVPADGILIPGLEELTLDESSLTGETIPVTADKPFLYCGCLATKGSGNMLVTAVGVNTEWGRTMAMTSDEQQDTPLQEKLEELVIFIGKIGAVVAGFVFFILVIYYIVDSTTTADIVPCNDTRPDNGTQCSKDNPYNWSNPEQCVPMCHGDYKPFEEDPHFVYVKKPYDPSSLMDILGAFIIAVTIIVVAIPEGLPLAVTISLAYSVKQMLEDQNLVRTLAACEVMGGATTICSDKTGTLTEGNMSVSQCWIAGNSYRTSDDLVELPPTLHSLLIESFCLNNDDGELIYEPGQPVSFLGNPTECALLVLTGKLGADYKKVQNTFQPLKKWGFTSQRKRMSTIIAIETHDRKVFRMYCKGAAEIVLERCRWVLREDGVQIERLNESMKKAFKSQIEGYASQGLRAITIAYRDLEHSHWGPNQSGDGFEEDLIMIGILAIEDPLRVEVPDSVLKCQRAGILVRMVTGDNILTARKIATDCHILSSDSNAIAMEGPDFANLSDPDAKSMLPNLRVLARSRPQDKLRLVELLLDMGEVVAVTGDGTNDAPALSRASVGLAMGMKGTEVAKSAAGIIILDDNFASIVKSVLWGRCIFDNIRKFLQFQLTVNVVALTVAFVGAVSKYGTPLTAVQLLWVNMIMDTMAALALGTEKPVDSLLLRKPYGKEGKLITPIMIRNIVGQSIFQLVVLFMILYAVADGQHLIFRGVPSGQADQAMSEPSVHYTLLFNTFVFCQIFNEINSRKVNKQLNVFDGILTNWVFLGVLAFTAVAQVLIVEFGGAATQTVPLSAGEWIYCVGIGFFSLPVGFFLRLIPVPMEHWEKEDGTL